MLMTGKFPLRVGPRDEIKNGERGRQDQGKERERERRQKRKQKGGRALNDPSQKKKKKKRRKKKSPAGLPGGGDDNLPLEGEARSSGGTVTLTLIVTLVVTLTLIVSAGCVRVPSFPILGSPPTG